MAKRCDGAFKNIEHTWKNHVDPFGNLIVYGTCDIDG
jgi:hypothetical protein